MILGGVEGLVRAAIALGHQLGTPCFLWGITIVAAGTSLPDAFVSVRAARRGEAVASLANVLGSNVFDLLVAVPAGVLVAGTAVVNYSLAVPMMGALMLANLLLFVMLRTGKRLTRGEAIVLLAAYGLFLAWIAAETLALVDLLPRLPPSSGK